MGLFLLIFTTFPDVKHKFENKAVHLTCIRLKPHQISNQSKASFFALCNHNVFLLYISAIKIKTTILIKIDCGSPLKTKREMFNLIIDNHTEKRTCT